MGRQNRIEICCLASCEGANAQPGLVVESHQLDAAAKRLHRLPLDLGRDIGDGFVGRFGLLNRGLVASKPREEWVRTLRESPGDFIFTIVNSVDDLPDDPQVRANDYVVDFEHPQYGKTQVLGMPVRLSETPGKVRTPAPEFGQHTEEILLELLGYDWDRITELRKQEVI